MSVIVSSGTVAISSGVTSTGLDVMLTGKLHVMNSGWAQKVSVSNGGAVVVSNGGILYQCTVSGGSVTVMNGGWAEAVSVENGGLYLLSSGASTHNTFISSGGVARIGKDVMATGITVLDGGVLHVSSVGYARGPVVSGGGLVHVSAVGIVDKAQSYGSIFVGSGGRFNSSTVNSGAEATIASGGSCSNVKISCGIVSMDSGALASAVVVDSGGRFVLLGTTVNGDPVSPGSSGLAKKTTVNAGGTMIVSGGTASNTTINSGGRMTVLDGGTATGIKENGGWVEIQDGANVSFAANTFSALSLDHESATVHSGTTAVDLVAGAGALLAVFSGGTATGVRENGGFVEIVDGAAVTFAANTFSGLSLDEGQRATVHSGTTALDVEVHSGGVLRIFEGGTLGGTMTFESGAAVSASEGGVIDFDLTRTSAGAEALLNDLSIVQGAPLYTLTVNAAADAELTCGVYHYALAGAADGFNSTISVYRDFGAEPESISVGDIFFIGKTSYMLGILDSVLTLTVTVPDLIAPVVSDVQASTMAPTNQDVTVTAVFSDNAALAASLYRIGVDGEWLDYVDGAVVGENAVVCFKAVDAAGNESEVVSFEVTNIDKVPPLIALNGDTQTSVRETSLTASTEAGLDLFYSADGETWTQYTNAITVAANAAYSFRSTDAAGNTGTAEIVFANILPVAPENLVGTKDRVSWDANGAPGYIVECSTDDFLHVLRIATTETAVDLFALPAGTYQWRVRASDRDVWSNGADIVPGDGAAAPEVVQSNADGNGDVFFANVVGAWGEDGSCSMAQHVGSVNDWEGTNEIIFIHGKPDRNYKGKMKFQHSQNERRLIWKYCWSRSC